MAVFDATLGMYTVSVTESTTKNEKMPQLTRQQTIQIIALSAIALSGREIARQLGIPPGAVWRLLKKWRQQGSMERRPGSGRRVVSTPEQDETLLNCLRREPFTSVARARILSVFPGCIRTARKRVRMSELRSRVAVRKLLLTPRHKEARIGFALRYLPENEDFWRNVIYTDEKTFQTSSTSKIRVYRPLGCRFQERYVAINNKNRRFSINLWGWICAQSRGVIVQIEDRLNANAYLRVLENVLLPSVRATFPENDFVLQHDNCPIHTARRVRDWLEHHNIQTLDWPSLSPDLNPIENLWGLLVKKIDQENAIFNTREELMVAISNAWYSIPNEYFTSLCSSMPRRLAKVIDANGAQIKY